MLDYDPSTYDMLHRLHVDWPSLSFDFLHTASPVPQSNKKKLKVTCESITNTDQKNGIAHNFPSFDIMKYPLTVQMVSGTQADRPGRNRVNVMKISRLHKTKFREVDESDNEDESDDNSDDEDDVDEDPILATRAIQHHGGVNRIRVKTIGAFTANP